MSKTSDFNLTPVGVITKMNTKQLTAFDIQQAANIIQQNRDDADVMKVFQLMFKGKKKNYLDWQMYGMSKTEFDGSMLNPSKLE